MKIRIKGVCVDINKPRSQNDLNRLLDVCKSEALIATGAQREFIQILINIIDKKLMKEYYSIKSINYEKSRAVKLS